MYIYYEEDTGEIKQMTGTLQTCYSTIPAVDPIPPDHPIRKALSIGQKVLEAAGPDVKMSDLLFMVPNGASVGGSHRMVYRFADNKPKPHKGLDLKPLRGLPWLKSLPVGTRRQSPNGGRFVIMPIGLEFTGGYAWLWGGQSRIGPTMNPTEHSWWHHEPWVQAASPSTCPTWEPEDV